MAFPDADLERLSAAEEIRVETQSPAGTVHRTIVWVMVRDGVVYLRSVSGERGRWYREALARPDIALHVDGHRIAARAVPAADEASVAACSAALRDKYRGDPSLGSMLRPETLPTTLRMEPASAAPGR